MHAAHPAPAHQKVAVAAQLEQHIDGLLVLHIAMDGDHVRVACTQPSGSTGGRGIRVLRV